VTTGSRRLTVEQFEEYARNGEVMQPYFALPETAQKKALFEDLLSYEVLAAAGARAGFDKDSAYAKIESDALPRLLPDALYEAHIGSSVKVSESEARIFYDAQKEENRLAVIALADEATAKSALAKLEGGTAFAEVAKAMSVDPNAARSGGEIPGWVTLGQLPLDVEKAVARSRSASTRGSSRSRTARTSSRCSRSGRARTRRRSTRTRKRS
jgi:parvulin-like peptidyl-prolyl isomerase